MRDSSTLAHRLLSIRGKLAAGFVSSLPDGGPVLIPRDRPHTFAPISAELAEMAWPLSDRETAAVMAAQWATLFSGTFAKATPSHPA